MKTKNIPTFANYVYEAKQYPELDKISKNLYKELAKRINEEVKKVDSNMQYKAQYVLEEIGKLIQDNI